MGYHPAINDAIVEVLGSSQICSASLLATGPAFEDAVSKLHTAGIFEVGVHLALTSEYDKLPLRPLTGPCPSSELTTGDGRFVPDVASLGVAPNCKDVRSELKAQIHRVQQAGLVPTHLDGHMFFYELNVGGRHLYEAVLSIANEFALPFRSVSTACAYAPEQYFFIWDGYDEIEQRIAEYRRFLEQFPETTCEMIMHPGLRLAELAEFTAAGKRRIADYFFLSALREEELSRHGIQLLCWRELRDVMRKAVQSRPLQP